MEFHILKLLRMNIQRNITINQTMIDNYRNKI